MNQTNGELFTWLIAAIAGSIAVVAIVVLFVLPGDMGIPVGVQFFTDLLHR